MIKNAPTAEVSDTTGADQGTAAGPIIQIFVTGKLWAKKEG